MANLPFQLLRQNTLKSSLTSSRLSENIVGTVWKCTQGLDAPGYLHHCLHTTTIVSPMITVMASNHSLCSHSYAPQSSLSTAARQPSWKVKLDYRFPSLNLLMAPHFPSKSQSSYNGLQWPTWSGLPNVLSLLPLLIVF